MNKILRKHLLGLFVLGLSLPVPVLLAQTSAVSTTTGSVTSTTTPVGGSSAGTPRITPDQIKNSINKAVQQFLSLFVYPDQNYTNLTTTQTAVNNQTQTGLPQKLFSSNQSDTQDFINQHILNVPDHTNTLTQYAPLISADPATIQQSAGIFNGVNFLKQLQLPKTISVGGAAGAQGGQKSPYDLGKQYITILANGNNPVETFTKEQIARGTIPMNSYLNDLGTFAAQQSIPVSTLLQLLEERNVQPDLMLNGNPVSPLYFDAYAASRRMQADWYNQILQNTPADNDRESLIIAAESRYELFQIRMQLEQLNGNLATLLLATQQGLNKQLLANSHGAAQRSIS